MINISIDNICKATCGSLKKATLSQNQYQHTAINSISTDTRSISKGALFIALKGPNFDAHQLLQLAADRGATALLVDKASDYNVSGDVAIIEVSDTRIALGLLAAFIKQQIVGLKCAAITGSNGKTTCKELLSAILIEHSGHVDKVLSTAGNFNNDIGLPLTLFRLQSQHQFAVLELGANHIGEIAYTSALVKPDVALINNVMPAHLEGFGCLQGVATAKAEIWASLNASGTAVVNLDANFAQQFVTQLEHAQQPFLCFSSASVNAVTGHSNSADVFATDIEFNELGQANFVLNVNKLERLQIHAQKIAIQLTLPGKHNVSNALAASTMALALGCSLKSIQQGLKHVQQVAGRVNCQVLSPSLTVIDDTYNANSASVHAAIDLLVQYQGEHLLICGDMGELGDYAAQEHQSIGEYAKQQHIEKLFTVGHLSQLATKAYNAGSENTDAQHFADKELLKSAINMYLSEKNKKIVILVKGSRSAKMEEIVTFIKQKINA